jgi:hypothetical protein
LGLSDPSVSRRNANIVVSSGWVNSVGLRTPLSENSIEKFVLKLSRPPEIAEIRIRTFGTIQNLGTQLLAKL